MNIIIGNTLTHRNLLIEKGHFSITFTNRIYFLKCLNQISKIFNCNADCHLIYYINLKKWENIFFEKFIKLGLYYKGIPQVCLIDNTTDGISYNIILESEPDNFKLINPIEVGN